jgi:tRNA A37 threonylcarbamoyladenosine modification protein TsaB
VIEDARRDEVYVQSFTLSGPGPARLAARSDPGPVESTLTGAVENGLAPAMPLAQAIAEIAAARQMPQTRPKPYYLRGADAALPTEQPPVILP